MILPWRRCRRLSFSRATLRSSSHPSQSERHPWQLLRITTTYILWKILLSPCWRLTPLATGSLWDAYTGNFYQGSKARSMQSGFMAAPTLGSRGLLDACLRSLPLSKSAGKVIISQFRRQIRRTWYPRWLSTRSLLGRLLWATKTSTSRSNYSRDRVEPFVTLYMRLLIRGTRTQSSLFLQTRFQELSRREKAKCNMIT